MSELPQDPSKLKISAKHAAVYLVIVIYFVISLAVLQLQSGSLGLIMLAPVFIGAVVVVLRMPRDTRTRIAAAQKTRDQTTVGRIMRFAEIAVLLYLAANGLLWLYKHH